MLTIIAGSGAVLAAGRARAEVRHRGLSGGVPVYQRHFVADRAGFFKEAGLDCKMIQGGSGVKTREIIASSQADIGIGDITRPQVGHRARSCLERGKQS